MTPLLLKPNDVLFFRDGRPIGGSFSGQGAAWPSPHVIGGAFHAALHRAGIEDGHLHRQIQNRQAFERVRKFGALRTAGPFPVYCARGKPIWYFPRPLDACKQKTLRPDLLPAAHPDEAVGSLPDPLRYPLVSTLPPSKESDIAPWITANGFRAYLDRNGSETAVPDFEFLDNGTFCDTEHYIGIGIDPNTGTQDGERFYSANYLRLREGYGLGILADGTDKGREDQSVDLIDRLVQDHKIVVGGQQRLCTTEKLDEIALPRGESEFPAPDTGPCRLKWVLLSPTINPALPAENRSSGTSHPGGWLPAWIDPESGRVELLDGPGGRKFERLKKRRPDLKPGQPIRARLVAALIGRPEPVTGWALPDETIGEKGGAKSTHLAVPAGSIYYFEAENPDEARKLAHALNWHGDWEKTQGKTIVNRRSTLLGEKGFGLGVCGSWEFYRK